MTRFPFIYYQSEFSSPFDLLFGWTFLGILCYANDPLYPIYSNNGFGEVVAGFSATVGIVQRLSPLDFFIHIEWIDPKVINVTISLLHHYLRIPPLRYVRDTRPV